MSFSPFEENLDETAQKNFIIPIFAEMSLSTPKILLSQWLDELLPPGAGSPSINAALPAVYNELREMAARYLRRERVDHTLQPTALVHESYLRLRNQHTVDWSNRLQFLSIAARMMRRILSDHADARNASKRGGDVTKLQLDSALEFAISGPSASPRSIKPCAIWKRSIRARHKWWNCAFSAA